MSLRGYVKERKRKRIDPVHHRYSYNKIATSAKLNCLILCKSLMDSVLIYLRLLANEYQWGKTGMVSIRDATIHDIQHVET